MKKKYIIKRGMITAAMAAMTVGALQAQVTEPPYTLFKDVTGGAQESIDSVTVGAVMSYKMAVDQKISAPGLSFIYQWKVFTAATSGSEETWTFKATPDLGTPLTDAQTFSGYVTDKEVFVKMPADPAEHYLKTVIQPVFNGATVCAYDTMYHVRVIAKPTLTVGAAETVVCYTDYINGNTFIPALTLTGVGSWELGYSVTATSFDGNTNLTISAGSTGTLPNLGTPSSTTWTIDPGAAKTALFPTVSDYDVERNGIKYEITFTTLTDRIMRKAYNVDDLDDLSNKKLTVYVMPKTVSQPLQHLKNL